MNGDEDLHNLERPAIILPDGTEEWWVHGRNVTPAVLEWFRVARVRDWRNWTNTEKTIFAIRFGNSSDLGQ